VKDFVLERYFRPKISARKLSRQTQLALAATKLALDDAGINGDLASKRGQIPIMLGISTSSYSVIEDAAHKLAEGGPGRIPHFTIAASQPQQSAGIIAEEFGLSDRTQTFASACPSGLDAIWAAALLVRSGQADLVVCGGADAPVCELGMAALQQAGLVTRQQLQPEKSSRPFNRDNDTGVISEGAGLVIMESYEHARARGARIYAEVLGHTTCIDPQPRDPGSGLVETMRGALACAGLLPQDIDYICAHGPGHPVLDKAETRVIKLVFGDHAYRIPVSSIKGVIGNPLAAAGPLQVIACSCAMRDGMIPPTANLTEAAPECDLDYVPGRARHYRARRILINAHGLGGGNSSLVLQEADAS
jgi:3-oxoacyl-[acyl-carrier-protein] synthase II